MDAAHAPELITDLDASIAEANIYRIRQAETALALARAQQQEHAMSMAARYQLRPADSFNVYTREIVRGKEEA